MNIVVLSSSTLFPFPNTVDDTVHPASTTAVPEQLDTKSVFDVLSKCDTFKSTKIIKTIKVSKQSFKIICKTEINVASFQPFLSTIGWIQLLSAPQRHSISFIFNLFPHETNEQALIYFKRFGTVDVWRRYFGTTTSPLGNGAIVWFSTIDPELLGYFYSDKSKKVKWMNKISASASTFNLRCSNCKLRYHGVNNCCLATAPDVIPEEYAKFISPSNDTTSTSVNSSSSSTENRTNTNSNHSRYSIRSHSTLAPSTRPLSSNNRSNNSTYSSSFPSLGSNKRANPKHTPAPVPKDPRPTSQVTCFHCQKLGHYAHTL